MCVHKLPTLQVAPVRLDLGQIKGLAVCAGAIWTRLALGRCTARRVDGEVVATTQRCASPRAPRHPLAGATRVPRACLSRGTPAPTSVTSAPDTARRMRRQTRRWRLCRRVCDERWWGPRAAHCTLGLHPHTRHATTSLSHMTRLNHHRNARCAHTGPLAHTRRQAGAPRARVVESSLER